MFFQFLVKINLYSINDCPKSQGYGTKVLCVVVEVCVPVSGRVCVSMQPFHTWKVLERCFSTLALLECECWLRFHWPEASGRLELVLGQPDKGSASLPLMSSLATHSRWVQGVLGLDLVEVSGCLGCPSWSLCFSFQV